MKENQIPDRPYMDLLMNQEKKSTNPNKTIKILF